MSNFFLLNEALQCSIYEDFKIGLTDLALINKLEQDSFYKHESLWNCSEHFERLFINYSSQEERFLSEFIEKMLTTESYLPNIGSLNDKFKDEDNGFLGVDFKSVEIDTDLQVKNQDDYDTFNYNFLWKNVNFRTFWKKRASLFPNLLFCGDVEPQISLIGNSSHFNQIMEKLKILNSAVKQWQYGNFSYKEITSSFALNISPESEQTLRKYGNERRFNLPSGESKIFDLHIKTGDLRFHFFPDNVNRKVYVGYIGPHLSTITN